MKDKLSLSDRTSFSRFSHRLSTDCMSDGRAGVEFLSFASCILKTPGEVIGVQVFQVQDLHYLIMS